MKAIKKVLNNIFIDGLSGMALGLFSTLIIGTILKQIGDLMGGTYGTYLSAFAVVAQRLTGAGIGIGVAYKFRESTYVLLSAAAAGMIGAYASNLIAGTLLSDTGALVLSGPGELLERLWLHMWELRLGGWLPEKQNWIFLLHQQSPSFPVVL